MLKTHRVRCMRIGLIWIFLLLCLYVYDLHFAREAPIRDIASENSRYPGKRYMISNLIEWTNMSHIDRELDGDTSQVTSDSESINNGLVNAEESNNALQGDTKYSVSNDVQLYEDALEISKDGEQKSGVYFSNLNRMYESHVMNVTAMDENEKIEQSVVIDMSIASVKEQQSDDANKENSKFDTKAVVRGALSTSATSLYRRSGREHWTISEMGKYNSSLYSPPPGEIPKRRFPKAIIIGAGKCGTRALLEFLQMHPHIVAANSELHFFDQDENFKKGFLYYRSKMPLSYSNQVTLEKTPSYIWSERAIQEIYKLNKNMKLILIIKDPVVRVISQAIRSSPDSPESIFIEEQGETLKVANESHTVDWGVYVKYIKMWLQVFPKSQLHIIESSQFITNPTSEIQKLEEFLGVPRMITEKNFYFNQSKGFYCMRPFHLKTIVCLSSGKGMPHPKINPILEKLLYKYYKPHNEELFTFLGRRFDWSPKVK